MNDPEGQSVVDEAQAVMGGAPVGAQPKPPVVSATPAAAAPKATVDEVTAELQLPGAERNIRRGEAGYKALPPQDFHLELALETHIEAGEGSKFRPIGKPAAGQAVVRLDAILTAKKLAELAALGKDFRVATCGVRVPTVVKDDHMEVVRNERDELISFFGGNRESEQYQKGHNALLGRLQAAARAIDAAKLEKEGKTLGKDDTGPMEKAFLNTCEAAGVSEYDTNRAYLRREVYGPLASDVTRFMRYYQEPLAKEIAKLPAPAENAEG